MGRARAFSLHLVNHGRAKSCRMKRLFIAVLILALAGGAHALLYARTDAAPAIPQGNARISLSGRVLEVPVNLIRDRAQMAGGRLDRIDLELAIRTFGPLPPASPASAVPDQPDRIVITIRPADDGLDAKALFQRVHARFLARETWSNPGGLVMRRFRPGTPYEDRELYIGAGGRSIFIALCPREERGVKEPCRAEIRQDGLDIALRFDARHLPDWRRITASASALVSGFQPLAIVPIASGG